MNSARVSSAAAEELHNSEGQSSTSSVQLSRSSGREYRAEGESVPWRHSQRAAWHPKPFMTGGPPPFKTQLDVVLLSALYIRGRCLEHLPKGCSGSCPRTVLS